MGLKEGKILHNEPSGNAVILKVLPVDSDRMPVFKPGQYTALGYEPEGVKSTRAYSICSLEDDPHWEFLITVVEGGDVSSRLAGLKSGDTVYYKETPKGSMTLERIPANVNSVIFVATGSGVGPFKPMVHSLLNFSHHRITLIHGARRIDDLHYRNFFSKLSKNFDRFIYKPVVSREQVQTDTVVKGRVTDVLTAENLDPTATVAFLCGNPSMIADVKVILGEKGFNLGKDGNVITESYW